MSFKTMVAPLLVALVATVGLAACGGSDGSGGGNDTVAGAFEVLPEAPAGYENLSGEAELTRSDGETTTTISLSGLEPDTEYMAHLHTGGCTGSDPGGPHFKFDPSSSDEPPNEIHLSFTADGDGSGDAETTSDQEVPAGEAGSVVLHLADPEPMAGAGAGSQFASLFVHEDEGHSDDEGGAHADEDGHHEGGAEAEEAPDKIACAELEGGAEAVAGDGGGTSAAIPTIVVKNGEPVGGIAELEFSAGEQIRFKVTGDEAEEIHIHGYDLMEDIPEGGGTVEFDFPAEIEGIFEGELEGQATQILELRVNP